MSAASPSLAARPQPPAATAAPPSFPPFDPAAVGALPPYGLPLLVERWGRERLAAESLIRGRFADAYGARIARFMPRLFSLHYLEHEPLGAFGLREAAHHRLFLERYLDAPIEETIAARLGRAVAREDVVEVGQFAGTGAGAFRALILRLTEALHHRGHRFVVFTGTRALRNAFARLELAPLELAPADPARLPEDERADWGSYYRHAPCVMVGDVAAGFAAVAPWLEGTAR